MSWKWWVKAPSPDRNLTAEQMERAQRAKQTLPLIYEAAGDVREKLMDQIIQSGPQDYEIREYFYQSVKGLDAVVAMVEAYAREQDMVEAMEAYKQKVNL